MARMSNGPLGGFQGNLGPVEGYFRKGQPILRSKRRKTDKVSEKQRACRQRMLVVNQFIGAMTTFVRTGFDLEALGTTKTANNLAKSYQLNHALTNAYPNYQVDYSRVRLCSGVLPVANQPVVEAVAEGLKFNWDFDQRAEEAYGNDQVMLLAYYPASNTASYILSGARRSAQQDILHLAPPADGEVVETYIAFISDDRKMISNSTYTGRMILGNNDTISTEETAETTPTTSKNSVPTGKTSAGDTSNNADFKIKEHPNLNSAINYARDKRGQIHPKKVT